MKFAYLILIVAIAGILAKISDQYSQEPSLTFDMSNATNLVEYSAAAYCNDSTLLPWICGVCSGNTSGFEVTKLLWNLVHDTRGYVGFHPIEKFILISFEGTDKSSLKNWITDLEISKVDYDYPNVPGAKVHSGFYNAFLGIKDQLMDEYSRLVNMYPEYPVYVTGHSLGASLASLSALYLQETYKPNSLLFLYTFGSPRVGNIEFSEYFYELIPNSFRVVNDRDVIPHLPLRAMNFHHVPQEIFIEESGDVKICDKTGEDPSCSDGIVFPWSVKDHGCYFHMTLGGRTCSGEESEFCLEKEYEVESFKEKDENENNYKLEIEENGKMVEWKEDISFPIPRE
jgi:hypothetical protein